MTPIPDESTKRTSSSTLNHCSNRGEWANTVRLEVDYDTQNPDETFNLRVIQEEGGRAIRTEPFTGLSMNPDSPRFAPLFVTQSSELIELSLHPDMGDPSDSASVINQMINSFAGFSQGRRPIDENNPRLNNLRLNSMRKNGKI
jgi:hypothetical protein